MSWLAGLALVLGFSAAQAAVIDSLNSARARDCAARGVSRFNHDRRLDSAAYRLSGGDELHEALAAGRYRADEVTAIRLSGIRSSTELTRALASGFCKTLKDARFADAGWRQRDADYWIVLAAPFTPPDPRRAAQVEEQVLQLVNRARAEGRRCGHSWYAPAPPLRIEPLLHRAAAAHAREMAAHSRLEHDGLDGSSPAQRVRRTGLEPLAEVGENIAGGPSSAQEAVEGWLQSPGHCANLMNAHYRWMGVAFAVDDRSELGIYWAQDFAAPDAQGERRSR